MNRSRLDSERIKARIIMVYPRMKTKAGVVVLVVGAPALLAAFPLVVDDGDVISPGEVEVVVAAAFEKAARDRTCTWPLIQISLGVTEKLEIGMEAGYQFVESRPSGEARDKAKPLAC